MTVIDFTSEPVFNAMFTIFVHLSALMAPLFGAIALARN